MKNTHNTSQNNADEVLNTKASNYMPEVQSVKYSGLNALNEQTILLIVSAADKKLRMEVAK